MYVCMYVCMYFYIFMFILQSNEEHRPPRKYRRLRINYGRLGLDEFDFSQYNSTRFAGLENIMNSSYTNSVLQVLYFVPQVSPFPFYFTDYN